MPQLGTKNRLSGQNVNDRASLVQLESKILSRDKTLKNATLEFFSFR